MVVGRRIASVDEVPEDGTLLFTVRCVEDGEVDEALLVRLDDGVACWLNRCQHFRHVRLDSGSGATMRGDEIVCTNHGAMFEVGSGRCTFGPCVGATLDAISVSVTDGEVYLSDPEFEYVGPGPSDEDGRDLTSTSNVEF